MIATLAHFASFMLLNTMERLEMIDFFYDAGAVGIGFYSSKCVLCIECGHGRSNNRIGVHMLPIHLYAPMLLRVPYLCG